MGKEKKQVINVKAEGRQSPDVGLLLVSPPVPLHVTCERLSLPTECKQAVSAFKGITQKSFHSGYVL